MEPIPPVYKPLVSSKILSTLASVAAVSLAYYIARQLVHTIRVCILLRNAPQPKERFPFSLILDMWHQVAAMDLSLPVPARLFKYFQNMFDEVIDNDFTIAFYGPKAFLIAITPHTVERVLSNSENVNKSFFYVMMKSWIGNGLLTSDKAVWKQRRKVLTPAFHFRILDEYVPVMNSKATLLGDKMAALGDDFFDVVPIMRLATFGILFETAMGIQLDEGGVEKIGFLQVNDEIATAIITRMMNIHHWPELIYKFTQDGRQFYEKVKLIKKFTRDILSMRKKTYKVEGSDVERKKSFMDILLRMHMEEGVFTEEEIREEVNTFMIGVSKPTAAKRATLH